MNTYHLMAAEAQVNPAPNAAKIMMSSDENNSLFLASHIAIGIDAAVVLP